MSEPDKNITTQSEPELANIKQQFSSNIHMLSAIACNNYKRDGFDLDKAMDESEQALIALGAVGGLQEMLAAQLISIHRFQQQTIAMANEAIIIDNMRYFSNTAIKLANCFIQQAALLAKLQGHGAQKMTIEHVTIHSGAQAIVGNVNGGTRTHEEKK